MSRRRRAVLLLGLALLLGGLAATDVARREQAVARELGPTVPVLVARQDLSAGTVLGPGRIAVRRVPARYAPQGRYGRVSDVAGLRTALAVPQGTDIVPALVASAAGPGPALRPGERAVDLVATGSPALVRPGGRVDVAITQEGSGDRPGRTALTLTGAEVLASRAAPDAADDSGVPRVVVSLRVTLRQALVLAEAQSFARDIRVLPRAAPGAAP